MARATVGRDGRCYGAVATAIYTPYAGGEGGVRSRARVWVGGWVARTVDVHDFRGGDGGSTDDACWPIDRHRRTDAPKARPVPTRACSCSRVRVRALVVVHYRYLFVADVAFGMRVHTERSPRHRSLQPPPSRVGGTRAPRRMRSRSAHANRPVCVRAYARASAAWRKTSGNPKSSCGVLAGGAAGRDAAAKKRGKKKNQR